MRTSEVVCSFSSLRDINTRGGFKKLFIRVWAFQSYVFFLFNDMLLCVGRDN